MVSRSIYRASRKFAWIALGLSITAYVTGWVLLNSFATQVVIEPIKGVQLVLDRNFLKLLHYAIIPATGILAIVIHMLPTIYARANRISLPANPRRFIANAVAGTVLVAGLALSLIVVQNGLAAVAPFDTTVLPQDQQLTTPLLINTLPITAQSPQQAAVTIQDRFLFSKEPQSQAPLGNTVTLTTTYIPANTQEQPNTDTSSNNTTTPPTDPSATQAPVAMQGVTLTLTPEEVAKHNTPQSCWLVVNGRVYDVTNYISLHPAGARPILEYCGKDATRAFAAYHSSRAWSLLEYFYIGDLGAAITLASSNTQGSGYTIPASTSNNFTTTVPSMSQETQKPNTIVQVPPPPPPQIPQQAYYGYDYDDDDYEEYDDNGYGKTVLDLKYYTDDEWDDDDEEWWDDD